LGRLRWAWQKRNIIRGFAGWPMNSARLVAAELSDSFMAGASYGQHLPRRGMPWEISCLKILM
jgi:hypothetical protein